MKKIKDLITLDVSDELEDKTVELRVARRLANRLDYEEAYLCLQTAESNRAQANVIGMFGTALVAVGFSIIVWHIYRIPTSELLHITLEQLTAMSWSLPFVSLGVYLTFNARSLSMEASRQVSLMKATLLRKEID